MTEMIQITKHGEMANVLTHDAKYLRHLEDLCYAVKMDRGLGGECGWFLMLELVQGSSDKFYMGGKDKNGWFIRYGRNGTQGTRKEHPSVGSVIHKLNEKLNKGYVQVQTLHGNSLTTYTAEKTQAAHRVPPGGGCLPAAPTPEALAVAGVAVAVNLSGISAMLTLVRAVQWDKAAQAWKGLNADGQVIMTLPPSVTKHRDWFDLETGNQIPSRGA